MPFKSKEDYNRYMRKYLKEYRAQQRIEIEQTKQELDKPFQQQPVKDLIKVMPGVIEEEPQDSISEILTWGYQMYLAAVDLISALEVWDYTKKAKQMRLIVQVLMKQAGKKRPIQYNTIYKAARAVFSKVLRYELPEESRNAVLQSLKQMDYYNKILLEAHQMTEEEMAHEKESFTLSKWVV